MNTFGLRAGGLIAFVALALGSGSAVGAKSNIVLNITNHRNVSLVELHATAVGDRSGGRTLAKALAPGSNIVVKFPRRKTCFFELHATYEDGTFTDFHHFDLCRDETINLVD
jgi:hypothetical protein